MIKRIFMLSFFLLSFFIPQALASALFPDSSPPIDIVGEDPSFLVAVKQDSKDEKANVQTENLAIKSEAISTTDENTIAKASLPDYLLPGIICTLSVLGMCSYWLIFRKRTMQKH